MQKLSFFVLQKFIQNFGWRIHWKTDKEMNFGEVGYEHVKAGN